MPTYEDVVDHGTFGDLHGRGQAANSGHRVDVRVKGDAGLKVCVGVVGDAGAVPGDELDGPNCPGSSSEATAPWRFLEKC
jgi:hypothetical protein